MTKVILLKTLSQAYYSSASSYTAFRADGFGIKWALQLLLRRKVLILFMARGGSPFQVYALGNVVAQKIWTSPLCRHIDLEG